ncbi:hypothetical protein XO10_02235 [Marinitoga sp. 1135]|uniref:lysylphosphatidylglycerol synthase transmembrane domain-containing protein n=1 Tax=unclassified Marinitoga TaxID=2640159 RepID=UPI0015860FCD|nr:MULTISPECIES: lysylphosphatidylglycerol synthase transmembrane domain-containing protein [unclassified Marinitoga]NUU95111.1 hypothetical protein [Marinitoga sp. 1135]NUU97043.1 hypothetical protein [Marinitoga sp. 1138]
MTENKIFNKKMIIKNILLAIFIGLAVNIVFIFYSDFEKIKETILYTKLSDFFIPFIIFIAVYIIEAIRLDIVLRSLGHKITFKDAFTNSVINYLFTYITPLAMGGQPFQIYHLKMLGIKARESTAMISSKFIEYQYTVIFLIVVFISKIKFIVNQEVLSYKVLLGGFTVTIIFSIFFTALLVEPLLVIKILKKFPKLKKKRILKLESWTMELRENIAFLWKKNFFVMVIDIILGILSLMIQSYTLYVVFSYKIQNFNLDFFTFFPLYLLVYLLVFYFPTPGSSGGLEAVYVLIYSSIFKNSSNVLISILIWRIATYYFQIVFGLIMLFLNKNLFFNQISEN